MMTRDLTPEQKEWLKGKFADTKNAELAERLGISPRSVVRLAREYGLEKTKEFLMAMQRNASEHGAKATRAMGGNNGAKNLILYGQQTRYKKGDRQKDRMDAAAYADMCKRRGEARKATFRAERRRAIFGLPQKTGLRVFKCPPEKVYLRNKLRKRGYEIERASNEAYITGVTHRSEKMEARGQKMGITFILYESNGELQ